MPRLALQGLDPIALAARQVARDVAATRRFPFLLERKRARMRVSPFAFLRGALPLYTELLSRVPELGRGPDGSGWIAADLHLENFGAFRPESFQEEDQHPRPKRRSITFGMNDFDEAVVAPFRFDVQRLLVSLLLASRELHWTGGRALALGDALLEGYCSRQVPPTPRPVRELCERARARTRRALLDARTELHRGRRRFVRGARYVEVSGRLGRLAERAFAGYAEALAGHERFDASAFEVEDVAFRVAGTGSLGALRLGVLTRGKGGADGAWLFDLKEEGPPVAAALGLGSKLCPAERVATAMHACMAPVPRMLGTARLERRSLLVRRLTPQEDKLDLGGIAAADLEPLAAHLGALTAQAHARGAGRPTPRWKRAERAALVERAIVAAGVHESAYLAYCRLTAG
ncbi:MAG: DUF2252 family protein [Polyangiaceae bacterium]|nr:DUF2252 family protein [Polyangiaceae bacterium]